MIRSRENQKEWAFGILTMRHVEKQSSMKSFMRTNRDSFKGQSEKEEIPYPCDTKTVEKMGERREPGKEEEDLSERSIKKTKEGTGEDINMNEVTAVETQRESTVRVNTEDKSRMVTQGRRMVSSRDIVLQLNGEEDVDECEEEDWMSTLRREEEEDDPVEEDTLTTQANPLCPVYHFSKKQHKEDCKKWRKALILKLLGKKLSNRFLMTRLLKLWCLTGSFEVIDLDNGYILVNFHEDKDYNHVLPEGPWIVVDHYVVVQRWRPMFDPYDEQIKRMAVWVRIPGLPLEFYSTQHLWRIGNLLGKTIKVDKNSLSKSEVGGGEYTEKAKYARICIEVDLRKSFISRFQLGDKVLNVAYEGLHQICFSYGRYGHRQESCNGGTAVMEPPNQGLSTVAGAEEHASVRTSSDENSNEAFGAWMVVQKRPRGRKQKAVPESKAEERGKTQPHRSQLIRTMDGV